MKVLLITQAPCTAGTFITKYLCDRLNPSCLVSEANPWWTSNLSYKSFNLLYPPSLPLTHGNLDNVDNLSIYSSALDEFFRIAREKSFGLIVVRDHLYSEFFLSQHWKMSALSYKPYWVDYFHSRGIEFRVVFTVRHPFDSYVSLCHSFKDIASRVNLETYSQSYLQAVASYKQACSLELLSIESLADLQDSHPVVKNLLKWASNNQPTSPQLSRANSWSSSGASGRSFSKPVKLNSRRYSTGLRKQALVSSSFKELCPVIGYDYELIHFNCYLNIVKSRLVDLELFFRRLPGLTRLLNKFGFESPSSQP